MHVEVEDLNDNAPVFNPQEYAVSISSHAQPGAELLNVIATDRDSGRFGEVTYDILPGDGAGLFDVDPQTGDCYGGRGGEGSKQQVRVTARPESE